MAQPTNINPNPIVTTHIWLGDEIAFDITASDVVKSLHGVKLIESDFGLYLYDAHGNVTELLDNEYEVAQSYAYDLFGIDQGKSAIRDTDMLIEMSVSTGMLMSLPVGRSHSGGITKQPLDMRLAQHRHNGKAFFKLDLQHS